MAYSSYWVCSPRLRRALTTGTHAQCRAIDDTMFALEKNPAETRTAPRVHEAWLSDPWTKGTTIWREKT